MIMRGKVKMNKKRVLIISLILIFLAVCAVICTCVVLQKNKIQASTLNIAFYDSDQTIEKAVTSVIAEFGQANQKTVNFYTIDKETELSLQIKKNKLDVIIAPAGYAVKKAVAVAGQNAGAPQQSLAQMFSSVQQAAFTKNGNLAAVPLILDNLEINIEKSAFYSSGMEAIATWQDIEQFIQIQKTKIDYPVSFAGSEPVFLLDLLGALGEALDGAEAYDKASQLLIQSVAAGTSSFDARQTANELFIVPDAPLAYSLYYLKQLIKNGYVTPASRELRHSDINSYITQRVTNLFFTTLLVHRTYDVKAVERFGSIYVPSDTSPSQRHFTSTITYAVPVSATKKQSTDSLIEYLVSAQTQGKLSDLTGLAPVLANCSTCDKQADDARFWVAATSTPLAGLGHEAELSDVQKTQLCDAIWELLY